MCIYLIDYYKASIFPISIFLSAKSLNGNSYLYYNMSAPDLNVLSDDLKKRLLEPTNDSEGWRSMYISSLLKSLYEPIVPTNKQSDTTAEKRTDEVINGILKDMELPVPTQTVSDVERLKRRIEELKAQVEKLEEQCTNLENGYSELKEQVAALSDDTTSASSDDSNDEEEAEDADDEAVDTPAESEGEEEEVDEPVPKRDEGIPCEITTAVSLLSLVYLFRLFLFACDLTKCSNGKLSIKDL
jgi:TolA-binding protein